MLIYSIFISFWTNIIQIQVFFFMKISNKNHIINDIIKFQKIIYKLKFLINYCKIDCFLNIYLL